jgi:hypothetical protein
MNKQSKPIDKSVWGDGPWQSEPDRLGWEHAGLPCLMVRHDRSGHWCGYVAVPPDHPLHGNGYEAPDVDIHGGLTYANACQGDVCHVAKPGEPDDVWWFGFDCAHAGDFNPMSNMRMLRDVIGSELYNHAKAVAANDWTVETYRDVPYVQAETNRLAEQLAAVKAEVAQ